MNRDALKYGGLIFGSLVFIFLAWYAHFVLRRADVSDAILVTLFFGSCAVTGFILLTAKNHEQRWFALDLQRLSRTQNLILAIVGFIWGVCFLWLALSKKISAFLQSAFRVETLPFFKAAFVVGFFISSYVGFRYLFEALRRKRKIGEHL